MKKLCTILFISIFQFSESSDFKLICNEIGISYDKNFSGSFTKIVNFENRTVSNYSGNYFDKIMAVVAIVALIGFVYALVKLMA